MLAAWSKHRFPPTSSPWPTSVATLAPNVSGAAPMSFGLRSKPPAGASSTPARTTAWSRPGRPTSSGMARPSTAVSTRCRHGSTSQIPALPPWWSWPRTTTLKRMRSWERWPRPCRRPRRSWWWRPRTPSSRVRQTRSSAASCHSAPVMPCKPAYAEPAVRSSSRWSPTASLAATSSRRSWRRSQTTVSRWPGWRGSGRSTCVATSPPAPATPRLCARAATPSGAATRWRAVRLTVA